MVSRRFLPSVVFALAVLPWAAPSGTAGQVPGYQQIDNRSIMAAYHAEVIEQVNRVMERWGSAWGRDDADGVADLYWENAVVIPVEGAPLQGRDAIRDYLVQALPATGKVEAFMLDFDASGGMAVVYGNYMLEEEGGAPRSGPLITVYLQRGRTWKIRSQVFADR